MIIFIKANVNLTPLLRTLPLILIALLLSGCEKSNLDSAPSEPQKRSSIPTKSNQLQANANSLAVNSISTGPAESWQKIDNPSSDGWDTEVLAEQATKQLKKLGQLYLSAGEVTDLVTANFVSDPLTPKQLKTTFRDKVITIQRGITGSAKRGGISTLKNELDSVRQQGTETNSDDHFKFKVISVQNEKSSPDNTFTTEVLFSLTFTTKKSITEKHATWSVLWQKGPELPKIADILVHSFSQSITKKPTKMFSDVTESTLKANHCYSEQLVYGMNHWLRRLPVRAMLNRFGTPGIALGDVNGDGLEDLYLCQEPGLPNRLFLQQPDGTALDVSAQWGVDWVEDSRCSILADFDNDGDQDLAVAVYGMIIIAENDQGKRFEPIVVLPTSWSTASLAASDYNSDGLLDIFVCAYVEEDNGESIGAANNQFVYHDAENGAPNSFFQNTTKGPGEFSFEDVTQKVGLNKNNRRWSFAASWEDYDNDGDQDLYVANDYGRNNLYQNNNGKFQDIAAATNTEDSASGMSVTWADYDKDGHMDLYVSNMFSAAGNRITEQQNFRSGTDQKIRDRFRRFARGNSLFRNTETAFEDNSIKAGVTMGRWAWGSNFVDINNDSFPDLIVANGYLSSNGETGDL